MTSLAKIAANRRNARLSTGPKTEEGKAAVSRNATKHGIFAAVPVVPDECPQTWEAHRAGMVEALAPVGLLEVNLAERAALLLWRLQRLARYEAGTVAAAVEDAEVPPLPPPEDEFSDLNPDPVQQTRDEQLRELRRQLRAAERVLAEVIPARDFLRSPPVDGPGEPVPAATARRIFEGALEHAASDPARRSDPPAFGSKSFLKKLGPEVPGAGEVSWTPELIGRGLAVYAACGWESPAEFFASVCDELEGRAEELERRVKRLGGEAAAVARLLDGGAERRRAAGLLPGDGRDERVAKYERHLHNLLTSTLHELERLQARREGEAVPPPAVADVNVTLEAGPG